MSNAHASDIELQQYVSDKDGCSEGVTAHIEACGDCQAAVAAYRLLFAEIKKQPAPAFDFDVSALLLPQLIAHPASEGQWQSASGQRITRAGRRFPYLAAALIFLVTGIPVYLLRKNIFYTFTGISSFFLYIILSAALITVLWRVLDMYKKYQQRMDSVHFY
jgi:hypothetical protein